MRLPANFVLKPRVRVTLALARALYQLNTHMYTRNDVPIAVAPRALRRCTRVIRRRSSARGQKKSVTALGLSPHRRALVDINRLAPPHDGVRDDAHDAASMHAQVAPPGVVRVVARAVECVVFRARARREREVFKGAHSGVDEHAERLDVPDVRM